jgi:hypothetical protein
MPLLRWRVAESVTRSVGVGLFVLGCLAGLAVAAAVPRFDGTFLGDDGDVITLEQGTDGTVTGRIASDGMTLPLLGVLGDGGASGLVEIAGTHLGFVMEFDGDELVVHIVPFDAHGRPQIDRAQAFRFVRADEPTAPAPPAPERHAEMPLPRDVAFEPGVSYRAGTSLAAPATGLSFTVPSGFEATYDAVLGAWYLKMAGVEDAAVMVLSFSVGDRDRLATSLVDVVSAEGDAVLRAAPTDDGTTLAASLIVTPHEHGERFVVELVATRGAAGNVAALLAIGAPRHEGVLRTASAGLSAGWRLDPPLDDPGAARLRAVLAGTDLELVGTGASHFSGGYTAYTSYSQNSTATYTFCSSGEYDFAFSDVAIFSTEHGTIRSGSEDAHRGAWAIATGAARETFLVLVAADGRYLIEPLDALGDGRVAISEGVFEARQSSRCR